MALINTAITAASAEDTAQLERQGVEKPMAKSAKAKMRNLTTATHPAPVKPKAKNPPSAGDGQAARKKASGQTKAAAVLKKLRSGRGSTIEALMEATGWQAHSVRGFLSAVVKKRLGLTLASEVSRDGVRRYRIDDARGTE